MAKREVEVVVISDVHLGTYGCHAKELLQYLKSIKPGILILNGDIIDIWQFSKSYWPESHMKVLRRIMKFITEGVPVYYLTGNHDEMLRKFSDLTIGSFQLTDKLVLELGDKKAWFFHGDVFDVTMQHSKWLAKLGAVGYDTLILLNSFVNWLLTLMKKEKMSFSKKIKAKFKDAVKFINDFEITAAELAIDQGYSYVVCGHIHQPENRQIRTEQGSVLYLNSGDWVENLTALEYHGGTWNIYKYTSEFHGADSDDGDQLDAEDLNLKLDIKTMLGQFYNPGLSGQKPGIPFP
ncbi:UDP-2,3-diacylglucosamine pyrophosphatase LpxH [Arcticibacter tournemirensis]|uniref:UDP-2,3-diacylglucosamine diphosphatase n=1 Tax=Arcticibacter tournemirensis TaxID=699437 RepID=A0A5M9HES1_9SPHI|nr:UDP-2,3-diacylglucosamine diphosphatase [Arcticibacter tournemirensis]KAA8483798.1 UDP-2,3-diacylglucosamine diphosphatase [Arcticibacter tournemirensis]TQM49996.1 UDP-2,3-diacylglucosamine pyrophosphatase LpxH [Arcticibacter tournemirensis]